MCSLWPALGPYYLEAPTIKTGRVDTVEIGQPNQPLVFLSAVRIANQMASEYTNGRKIRLLPI